MYHKGAVFTGSLCHACLLVVAAGDGMAAGRLHVQPWGHLVGTAPGAGEAGATEAMDLQEEGDDLDAGYHTPVSCTFCVFAHHHRADVNMRLRPIGGTGLRRTPCTQTAECGFGARARVLEALRHKSCWTNDTHPRVLLALREPMQGQPVRTSTQPM